MIQIGDAVVSLDVIESHFVCDLDRCKGACCVQGDSGAPLHENEIVLIEGALNHILPFMDEDGKDLLEKNGFWEHCAHDGSRVTTCRNNGACVFVYLDQDLKAKCAIETAWRQGLTEVMKPLSCHLYPIRVQALGDLSGLNYHRWDICSAACTMGSSLKVPLYVFLKEPLIRAFGEDWYAELTEIAAAWSQQQN